MSDVTTASKPAPVQSAISGDGAVGDGIVVTGDTATLTTLKIAPERRSVSADGAVLNRHCSIIENSAANRAKVTSVAGLVVTDRAAGNGQHACIVDATGEPIAHVRLNRPSINDHGAGVGDAASAWNTIAALTINSIVIVNDDLIERHRSAVIDAAPSIIHVFGTHNGVSGDRAMSDRQS